MLLDVQNDFLTGPLKVKGAENVIEPLKRLVVAAHLNNVPVIYTVDAHYPMDVEVTRKWGSHTIKGTEGAQVVAELEPDKTKDYVVEKRTYSGFFETGLDFSSAQPVPRRGRKNSGAGRFTHSHLHSSHGC